MLKAEFFAPVSDPSIDLVYSGQSDSLASVTSVYSINSGFPDIQNAKVAIIGVPEYRGSAFNRNFKSGTAAVREHLYRLKKHAGEGVRMIDLGDLLPGENVSDTYFALAEIIAELIRQSVIPVVIGGSQDLTTAQYKAYAEKGSLINMVAVDSRFDLGLPDEELQSNNWLGKIVMQQPNFLFNFSNIGYQTYYVGASSVELMGKLYFDAYRVGEVRTRMEESEPVIRTADMLSFDLSAIRQSDAPGSSDPSPHGFTGEEACQLMMYAGMNDRLSSLGFYEYEYARDRDGQTAQLIAHMIWYFLEGLHNRKGDFPNKNIDNFLIYRIPESAAGSEMVFLKHKLTGRWWMEVPRIHENRGNFINHNHYLPCSGTDYRQACENEIPERYWQALQKL